MSFENLFKTGTQTAATPVPAQVPTSAPVPGNGVMPQQTPFASDAKKSLADILGNAKLSESDKTASFLPGTYPCLEVQEIKEVVSTKPKTQGHRFFVNKYLILKSDVEMRPAGTDIAPPAIDIDGAYQESSSKDIIRVLMAVTGRPQEELANDEVLEMIMDVNSQPCTGRLVSAECHYREGKIYPIVKFSAIPGTKDQHIAAAAELKKELGLAPF